jgi:hypothetical protein
VSFEELSEFRAESKDLVVPFRRAMLRLSKELNGAISSDAQLAEVRKEARFLVETTVAPDLEQMREELLRPTRPWYKRIGDLAVATPELVGAFTVMPTNMAIAAALAKAIGILTDVRDVQLEREGLSKRAGFHYPLKLQELGTA